MFDLFGALGAAGARGSGNAMNRNPLPRGRAAESVDWLMELFKFLPPTPSSIDADGMAISRASARFDRRRSLARGSKASLPRLGFPDWMGFPATLFRSDALLTLVT